MGQEASRGGKPGQPGRRGGRSRLAGVLTVALATLVLAGCSTADAGAWARLGMPEPASDRADSILNLWVGAWIAAFVVGAIVWGAIIWAIIAYRKRSDAVPVQTRYHVPIETLFTVVPFVIIAVLFFFTVRDQNAVLATEESGQPDQVIQVVGQQWSWTFNYLGDDPDDDSDHVWDTGTPQDIPDLYLPYGEVVGFQLNSADTLHSFWIPDFLFKMDVFPGRTNYFELTPTKEGTFAGKCAELCGAYHSRMLFNVHVVSPEEYDEYRQDLRARGQTGTATGGELPGVITGLDAETGEAEEEDQ